MNAAEKKIRMYTSSGQDTINLVGNVSPPNPLPRRGSTKGRDTLYPAPHPTGERVVTADRHITFSPCRYRAFFRVSEFGIILNRLLLEITML